MPVTGKGKDNSEVGIGAEGYFQRRKNVESVADVIQNRVGLYLREQMK